jgi:hypothetical protein
MLLLLWFDGWKAVDTVGAVIGSSEECFDGYSKCFISREFGNGLVIGLGFELQVWEFLICLFVWHQVNARAFHTLS